MPRKGHEMSIQTAKEGMRELATKAQDTVSSTELSTAEKREALNKIEADIKAFSDEIAMYEQAQRLISGGESAPEAKAADAERVEGTRVKSLAQQVVESEQYKQAVGASKTRARFSTSLDLKTVGTVDEGSTFADGFPTGQGGAAVLPQFLPGIVGLRFRKLQIADLFAQGATNSDSISYAAETAFNNSAAGVAETSAYAQSDDALLRKVEQVGKIAHYMKATDEIVQDAAQYMSFLENRMVFGVQYKEDSELLVATGYPSVNGLLNRSGFQSNLTAGTTAAGAAPSAVIDDVYKQVSAIRANAFLEPDAVVVHPTDWQNIRLAKDANSQYYGGGPFTGAYGNGGFVNVDSLWGLRVVISAAIASGTILVGSFQMGGQVFRRSGITVEMTNTNDTDFVNGLITVRAEERLALAVYYPGAFGKVTVLW